MGGHQQPGPPTAYSTRTTYGEDGFHADGHKIVIEPRTLQESVDKFKKQLTGQNSHDLLKSLRDAMATSDAFGQVPNADQARKEMNEFIDSHAREMEKMSQQTLVEFIARVQAAAELGYETDPATRAAAAQAHAHMRME